MTPDEERAWVEHWADREDAHGGFPGFSGVPRSMATSRGEVTAYDATRAIATVRLESGEDVEMHAGCYFSGRPARLPQKGDRILASVKAFDGVNRVIVARPQNTGLGDTTFPGPLVPNYDLNEATFQLLASSTAQRYTHQAVIFSRKARLSQKPEQELRERMQVLWSILMQTGRDARPVEEIEAALILVALWDKDPKVTPEFQTVRDFTDVESFPGTLWLVTLVKKLQEDF